MERRKLNFLSLACTIATRISESSQLFLFSYYSKKEDHLEYFSMSQDCTYYFKNEKWKKHV